MKMIKAHLVCQRHCSLGNLIKTVRYQSTFTREKGEQVLMRLGEIEQLPIADGNIKAAMGELV